MKQLLQDLRSRELSIENVPAPSCHAGGVLVRNVVSLISSGTERATIQLGSKSLLGKAIERPDLVRQVIHRVKTAGVAEAMAAVRTRLDTDTPLGYSLAGVVLEAGEGVTEFTAGDRVACAGAGHASHAEINWVPRNLAARIPPEVDFESASAVAVGAIALEGVRIAEAKIGERILVIGLGLVGQLTLQLLKAAGCVAWGIDPDPERVRLALELGADFACENRAWNTGPWKQASERGEGPDAVIITAATHSTEPVELAGSLVRDRGVVVVVGDVRVDVPREHYYKKELQIRYSRSYGPGRYDPSYEENGADYPYGFVRWTEKRNMEAFLELVAAQKVHVNGLITHRFDIADALSAYRLLSGETPETFLGIVLNYGNTPEESKRIWVHAPEPSPPKSSSTLHVGWIGAGSFSRAKLLPALRKIGGIECIGLVNGTGLSARRAAKAFGFSYCATDANEVLGNPAINAVFIGTRHNLHAALVVAALEQKKHVFVEKPLCVTREELDEVREAYSRSSQVLAVGFNRRFSRFALECRKFFEGRREPFSILYRISAGHLPPNHWIHDPDQGHGRIVGEVCHFVDFLQFMTSSEPVKVQASSVAASADPEDNVHIRILFADGSYGEISYLSSGDASLPKERIEIFGQGRTAICEDFKKWHFYQDNRRKSHSLFRQDKGHREELRAFTEAVKGAGSPPIPFESLYLTTLTTFCIRESLQTGKAIDIAALRAG